MTRRAPAVGLAGGGNLGEWRSGGWSEAELAAEGAAAEHRGGGAISGPADLIAGAGLGRGPASLVEGAGPGAVDGPGDVAGRPGQVGARGLIDGLDGSARGLIDGLDGVGDGTGSRWQGGHGGDRGRLGQ